MSLPPFGGDAVTLCRVIRRVVAVLAVLLLAAGCMVGPGPSGPRDNRPGNRPPGPPPPSTIRQPDAARAFWFRAEAYDTRGPTAVPYRGITIDVFVDGIGVDGRPVKRRDPATGLEFEGPDILLLRPLPYGYYTQHHPTVLWTSFHIISVGNLPPGIILACWVEDEAGNELPGSYTEAGPSGPNDFELDVTCIYPVL